MEWLTPTLFLFHAELPEHGGEVEVIAEVWLGRRGERNASGLALEPDEPPELHLWSVSVLDAPEDAKRWEPHEKWLLGEAARRLNGKNRNAAAVSAWRMPTALLI